MTDLWLTCEHGCRDSTIQGPQPAGAIDKCVYCGGPLRPVTAEEWSTWREGGRHGRHEGDTDSSGRE